LRLARASSYALAGPEARQRHKRKLRLRQREERSFRLEPAMPAHAGPLELLRLLLSKQIQLRERSLEGQWMAEFAQRHLSRA
jgi:hypothetical protein